jgi:hypothetical protein
MLLDLAFCVMLCRLLFVLLSFFFWPLCCLSFDLRLLITPLVSFGHCVVCPLIYGFWLPLWYLFAIVLSVLWSTASDYPFGIFWPLCCLSFDLRLLITSLVSFVHCVVCPLIYDFWLPLWYLLTIVLSVLWSTASDYLFGIFWPLCCLSFDLRLLITSLVSFDHCVVCPLIYGFWLPLWYLLAIVLSVLWFTSSDYPFGIFWPLCCLSFDLRLLITSLVSFGHCVVCPLIYVFWLPRWYLLTIVLSVLWFYVFWLPLWYLLAIVLSVLWSTASDYPVGIFWPLCCLSFDFMSSDYPFGIFCPLCCLSFDLRLLITSLVSFGHCVVSFDLRLLITPLVSFVHCVVCPLIYGFWLPRWYLLTIVLSVLWFYVFWLPLWYLLAIVLSVLWFTSSDYPFGIFWPLCCLSFDLRLLITSLVSFVYCVVCPLIYVFW